MLDHPTAFSADTIPTQDFSETVVDFFYVDDKKVRMLTDQILGDLAYETRSTNKIISGKKSGAFKASLLKFIGTKIEVESGESVSEALTHGMYWRNAKALLEVLRASAQPPIEPGVLCHLSGSLMVLDLTFFRDLQVGADDIRPIFDIFEKIGLFDSLKLPSKNGRRQSSPQQARQFMESLALLIANLAKRFPSRVVGIFSAGQKNFWFTMSECGIQQEYKDAMLRYRGVTTHGTWHLAAIIDAMPSESLEDGYMTGKRFTENLAVENQGIQNFVNGLYDMGGVLLGMREHMYTAMPVILYRHLRIS